MRSRKLSRSIAILAVAGVIAIPSLLQAGEAGPTLPQPSKLESFACSAIASGLYVASFIL